MMSNMKKVSQYFIAFLWLWVGTAQADLTIQIDQSSDSALPVAILPFEWQGKTVTPPVNMSDVIGNDLLRSGKFRPVAESRLPARPKTLDEVDFAEWKQLGTDNLLIGQLKEDANGHYEIECDSLICYVSNRSSVSAGLIFQKVLYAKWRTK